MPKITNLESPRLTSAKSAQHRSVRDIADTVPFHYRPHVSEHLAIRERRRRYTVGRECLARDLIGDPIALRFPKWMLSKHNRAETNFPAQDNLARADVVHNWSLAAASSAF